MYIIIIMFMFSQVSAHAHSSVPVSPFLQSIAHTKK